MRGDEAFAAYEIVDGRYDAGLVLLCDHAENALPSAYGTLGLPQAQLQRHIGYDIGAAPIVRGLAARLAVPAVLSRFSRLLIDPNRGEDDPTLIMRLSDGAVIPGNHPLSARERAHRLDQYYRPYHAAISAIIDKAMAAGRPPALFSVHSFTHIWRGVPRPWEVGLLWDRDPRFARACIDMLAEDPALTVGDNEPYKGALRNDCMYRHGTSRGLAHALIEVRQDLIDNEAGVEEWVDRLEPILRRILTEVEDLNEVRMYGSQADD